VVVVRDAGAVIAFVVVWQAVTIAFSVPAFLVPPPSAIAEAFVANAGRIGAALAQTGVEAAAGFVGGNLLGLILATAFARSRRLERIGLPVAIAVRSVPLIAMSGLPYGRAVSEKIGAAAFFAKPFDIALVARTVRALAARRPHESPSA